MSFHPDASEPTRRVILKGAVAGVALAASGSLALADTSATDWPAKAFQQKSEADVLKALYGRTAEASDKISLDAPEIAENGAVVPVSVSSSLPNVTAIAILVPDNPNTLAAAYTIPEGTEASVANRLKMAKTSKIIAVVESGGKLFSASKEVKVTIGGCGG